MAEETNKIKEKIPIKTLTIVPLPFRANSQKEMTGTLVTHIDYKTDNTNESSS